MKLDTWHTDDVVLAELGKRLAQRRQDMGATQTALAFEAGVGKRTLERIEAGAPVQTISLVRVLRALRLIDRLEALTSPAPRQPVSNQRSVCASGRSGSSPGTGSSTA